MDFLKNIYEKAKNVVGNVVDKAKSLFNFKGDNPFSVVNTMWSPTNVLPFGVEQKTSSEKEVEKVQNPIILEPKPVVNKENILDNSISDTISKKISFDNILPPENIEENYNAKNIEEVKNNLFNNYLDNLKRETSIIDSSAGISYSDDEVVKKILDKYEIPQSIQELENVRKNIIAYQNTLKNIIEEEKNTPGVKEEIRQKRIKFLTNAAQSVLDKLNKDYNYLSDLYDKKLSTAKYELGLYEKSSKDRQRTLEQLRDNTRQMIQQMITTGALGELSDEELRNLSLNSGYTLESLKTIRRAVKSGNERKIEKALLDMEAKAQQMDIARERLKLAEKSKEEKVLSPTDIKNLKKLYGVSLPYGITEKQAQEQIKQLTSPRDFTDEELRTIAKNMKSAGLDFNKALQEFRSDKIIQNKDKAELITREVYGKTNENKNLINSFFARLFGK